MLTLILRQFSFFRISANCFSQKIKTPEPYVYSDSSHFNKQSGNFKPMFVDRKKQRLSGIPELW
jgi:hypothetical protein